MATKKRRINVLLELKYARPKGFEAFTIWKEAKADALRELGTMLPSQIGRIEISDEIAPIPMFSKHAQNTFIKKFAEIQKDRIDPIDLGKRDVRAATTVVAAWIDEGAEKAIEESGDIKVWPNSAMTQFATRRRVPPSELRASAFDRATSAGGTDCEFKPAVDLETIRDLLGVRTVWNDGFRGQNVAIGILDEGIDGHTYPVVDKGYSTPGGRPPGAGSVTGHGSMCAAAVVIPASAAKLYDYPFADGPTSAGALESFQCVLDQRKKNGTPQVTSSSYGFTSRPRKSDVPTHETWDPEHPVHRKIREVTSSGGLVFFAAGNCGSPCADEACESSVTGPGNSIIGSNSLIEVITVAAVNSEHDRVGYSAQGPGGFAAAKPDLAAYTHYFGNFGPDRPGGTDVREQDEGTSASCPLAAGVAALLLSAFPAISASALRDALVRSATDIGVQGWDGDTGFGVINAAAAYALIKRSQNP